jgi:hypothetical protein
MHGDCDVTRSPYISECYIDGAGELALPATGAATWHSTNGNAYGTVFAEKAGYNRWAELAGFVVLYLQVLPSNVINLDGSLYKFADGVHTGRLVRMPVRSAATALGLAGRSVHAVSAQASSFILKGSARAS